MRLKFFAAAGAATLLPVAAFAHTGTGAATDLTHGFLHPLTGVDHILAMVAVGILAYQVGGRALWLVPLSFVFGMIFGGVFGMAGVSVPLVELGIALSVIVLGAIVGFGMTAPVGLLTGLVGLLAVFHGHAHGTEIPETASGLTYAIGFATATGLLHLCGIGIGLLIGRAAEAHQSAVVRTAGVLMTIAGIGMLAGVT